MRICSTRESYPHILSTHESYPQGVILDSFEQASEIKCPKLVTKYQNDSKAEFTDSPSETDSDSDSIERTEDEDKVSANSVIYSGKSH